MDSEVEASSILRPGRSSREGIGSNDPLLFIYTSGTTGLPKASKIKHLRYFMAGSVFGITYKVGTLYKKGIYCPLPLYHSSGGMLAVSMGWFTNVPFILARKFSASSFFADCKLAGVDCFIYVGELCRYLLAKPVDSLGDSQHSVRLGIGNGMRPEIWEEFKKRFGIPVIGEFYASSEGNNGILNSRAEDPRFSKPGCIGYLPPLLRMIHSRELVKFDTQREELVKDPHTGFCLRCGPNEVGELVSRIKASDPLSHYDGYLGISKEKDDKRLFNVFKKGDEYFRSGDLLRFDEEGAFYFVDRLGDTFRWKGENVATTDVAKALAEYNSGGLNKDSHVIVYGVSLPGCDGRAGIARIMMPRGGVSSQRPSFSSEENLSALAAHLRKNLPPYAVPLFLRVHFEEEEEECSKDNDSMAVTGTFKYQKGELKKEGFDPESLWEKARDRMFFLSKNTYVPLDASLYQDIVQQKVRF